MQTAILPQPPRSVRLFRNGSNQALRLPREFELDADEVYIRREGKNIIITPKPRSWADYFANARRLSGDFPDDIADLPAQQREAF
jgi:antitoxin VapB